MAIVYLEAMPIRAGTGISEWVNVSTELFNESDIMHLMAQKNVGMRDTALSLLTDILVKN